MFHRHNFVILLWGNLMFPLSMLIGEASILTSEGQWRLLKLMVMSQTVRVMMSK